MGTSNVIFFCSRYSSEFLRMAISCFETNLMTRALPVLEELIQLAMKDPDAATRRNGRRYLNYY